METISLAEEDSVSESVPPSTPAGTVLWQFQASDSGDSSFPGRNCPAVDGRGQLYACVGDRLFAFHTEGDSEADAGLKTLWSRPTGGVIPGSPAVGPDGHVRVHSGDGLLHCFDSEGRPVWDPVSVGEPLLWACPLVDAENATWISRQAGGLAKVDADGQTPTRPFFRSLAKLDSCGVMHNGSIVIGAEDQFVYAIDVTGAKGFNRWNQNENRGRTGGFINSAPCLFGGESILVTSSDQHLYAFDRDGSELWKTRLPGHALTSPVASENRCFVGVSAGERPDAETGLLWCVDGRNGHLVWEYPVKHPVITPPVVGADRVVYFGDRQGVVYAVTAKGTSEWQTELPGPLQSGGTLFRPGELVFLLRDGSFVGLKCSSQQLGEGWPKYRGTLAQSGLTS